MKRKKKIEPGARFGKLTVIEVGDYNGEKFADCRCVCGQRVVTFESQLLEKKSCMACAEQKDLKQFTTGEIVLYRNAIGILPFGAQAIVNRLIQTERISAVEIEYRGRFYNARPGELESLGVNFYGRKRRKTKISINEN